MAILTDVIRAEVVMQMVRQHSAGKSQQDYRLSRPGVPRHADYQARGKPTSSLENPAIFA
jgi:hypothetical protein